MKTHPTVGWRFRGMGGVYRCTRYDPRSGFWMRMLERAPDAMASDRNVGDEACVSERAIGRTYHLVWQDEEPVEHEQPCGCSVCSPKGDNW